MREPCTVLSKAMPVVRASRCREPDRGQVSGDRIPFLIARSCDTKTSLPTAGHCQPARSRPPTTVAIVAAPGPLRASRRSRPFRLVRAGTPRCHTPCRRAGAYTNPSWPTIIGMTGVLPHFGMLPTGLTKMLPPLQGGLLGREVRARCHRSDRGESRGRGIRTSPLSGGVRGDSVALALTCATHRRERGGLPGTCECASQQGLMPCKGRGAHMKRYLAKPQEPFQQATIPPALLNQSSNMDSSDAVACIKRGRMAATR